MFILHKDLMKINPNFYTISDFIHWKDEKFIPSMEKTFPNLKNTKFFFESSAKKAYEKSFKKNPIDAYFIKINESKIVSDGHFSINPNHELYWARSVVSDFSIPLAIYMGFKEIYLLGCDFNADTLVNDKKEAWFYDLKDDDRNILNSSAHINQLAEKANKELIFKSFETIKKFAEQNNIQIKNATEGGTLNVFERVNLNELY